MTTGKLLATASILLALVSLSSLPAAAQSYTVTDLGTLGRGHTGGAFLNTLVSFDGSNGETPNGGLVQGLDGNLYGTTPDVLDGAGTVFKMTPSGALTTLYTFLYTPPAGGLVLGTDGNFYGATDSTIFKVTPSGKESKLYTFCSLPNCADGSFSTAPLVQGTDGNFYGTTTEGGTFDFGTIFKITPTGTLTTLHSFNFTDGQQPNGGLVQATNGSFYGTTYAGGANKSGTVFRITAAGELTTIYNFCPQTGCADGAYPLAGLAQAADGNFYGTTSGGGSNSGGTVFKISPLGVLTTLHTFDFTDGAFPKAAPVQATDGNFYGTTTVQSFASGTVFEITAQGAFTTLYSFCVDNCPNGNLPYAGLLQATNGNFYGTTESGGGNTVCGDGGCGTIFSLSVGLWPYVEALPYAGRVGQSVKILGQGLTGTKRVSFNGVVARFTVNSDTYLTATVPNGANTGKIRVTTSTGTLISNNKFRVIP